MPVRPIVASIVAAAALLAGCGGREEDSPADAYVTAVNAAQKRFSASVARTGDSTATAATISRMTRAVEDMARELRSIDAPASVDRLHERLVVEVTDFRGALGEAQRALRSGDRTAILAERRQLRASAKRATREIEATLQGIDRTLRS